jgi:CheY-like chemotaxis protein
VLVVDDNTDTLELIAFILKQCQAQVTTAASASEALEALASDAYELIARIRTFPSERGGHIPAVALTAFARDEERTLALKAGFQMHLSKPVQPAELVAVVAHLAGRVQ